MVLTFGTTCLMRSRCGWTGSMSETPVTLASGALGFLTRPAATGSVTAAKTMGMVVVALTAAWLVGVATERIRSTLSPTNFWAMVVALAMSP